MGSFLLPTEVGDQKQSVEVGSSGFFEGSGASLMVLVRDSGFGCRVLALTYQNLLYCRFLLQTLIWNV